MITYKEVLNKGLVKEAAPRWAKFITGLADKGKINLAQKLLNRAGISSQFSKLYGRDIGQSAAISLDNLIQSRAHTTLSRFLNRPGVPTWKRALQGFSTPELKRRLLDLNRTGNTRYINFIDKALNRWGLVRNGDNYGPGRALQKFFILGTPQQVERKKNIFAKLLQNSKVFKYIQPQLLSIRTSPRLSLYGVKIPIVNQNSPSTPINISDFIVGAKDLKSFRRDFNTGRPLFMSGDVNVANRYLTGKSRGGGNTLLGAPKAEVSNLFFTPHLATVDQQNRIEIMRGLENGTIKLRDVVHNPDLDLNGSPLYQTIIDNKFNPDLLQKLVAIRQVSPGNFISKQINWQHSYPYSKLQSLLAEGILHNPR